MDTVYALRDEVQELKQVHACFIYLGFSRGSDFKVDV